MMISEYRKEGFVGVDVDLETSLFEYGLIWKEYKCNLRKRGVKKGEIRAVCCTDPEEKITDYGYFTKEGLLSETWIEFDAVARFQGCTVEELKNQDAGNLLFSLISYYGHQNFF